MISSEDISNRINTAQEKFDKLGVGIETVELFYFFYAKHRDKFGSFKGLIGDLDNKYIKKMDERYDFCFKKIEQTYRILERQEPKNDNIRLMWYI